MSTLTHAVVRQCPACSVDLPLGAVACPACHTLVYAVDLESLSRQARALEAQGDLLNAREAWNRALPLLPPDSKQAQWIREKLHAITTAMNAAPDPEAKPDHAWARKLGPLGPIAIVLAKSKGILFAIFKLKFLFSFFAFLAIYIGLFGWRFGIGFAVSILIHELGHYIDIRRRGLPAEMPVFLPGLGAYVKWSALGVSRSTMAQISLAGPLAGWMTAAACYLLYVRTNDPLWVALARTGATINILNLIPIWILDGGKAMDALSLLGRTALLAISIACWLYFGETIFFLVALGIGFRLFTLHFSKTDKVAHDDWGVWLYYAALLGALGAILQAVPESLVQHAIR